ncbi:hypothetical protein ABT297_30770 [Dactylosporangium sp. NPDC000555]|uniref:hypothetical protein n=1 Tax=Dactylosporangium sp. NPDC000555 TaxID=3154260 RepID=UPI003319E420
MSAARADRADLAPIRLGDVMAAEVTKLRTLPAAWIALGSATVANTALGILARSDAVRVAAHGDAVPIGRLGTLMLAPVYVFIAITVFATGSEYRGGQLRVSLSAVPRRHRLFLGKLAVGTAAAVLAAIPAVLPGYLAQHASATAASGRAGELAALLVIYPLLGLVGFGFAILARTVVAPLAVLFIVPVVLSPPLRGAVPSVVRFLPHEAALSLLGMPASPDTTLDRPVGLLVLAAWATLSVLTAWAVFTRRDN